MILDALRAVSLIGWSIVALAVIRSALCAVRGNCRSHDGFRGAFFFVALCMMGFDIRGLIGAGEESVRLALHALSALLAIYVLRVCLSYGRGRVGD